MMLETMLMLQGALQVFVTTMAIGAAWNHGRQWPFLTTFAMICCATLLRRLTAWLVVSPVATRLDWVQRIHGDMIIVNNVVIPMMVSIFMMVFIVETMRYLSPYSPRVCALSGKVRHG